MSSSRELTLVRVFDVPVNTVFRYWTDPKLMAKWFGPKGFTIPVCKLTVKVGGKIYIEMEDTDGLILKGSRYPMTGSFQEIRENKKIVYASQALLNGKPMIESLATVAFEEVGGKTKMTLRVAVTKATLEAEKPLRGMETGWRQSFDKLAENLG